MQLMNIKIENFEIERFNAIRMAIGKSIKTKTKLLNNESVYVVITLHNGFLHYLRHT